MLASATRISIRAPLISRARLMSSGSVGEVRWSGVEPTESQADVAADRSAADFPSRPDEKMQQDTVKFLNKEDKARADAPKDGPQAAADFAKLQKAESAKTK